MTTTPKNLFLYFGILCFVALFYIFVLFPISPLGIQIKNLKLAQKHASLLSARAKGEPKLTNIKFAEFTARNGCLAVNGKAETENDIYFITNFVESSQCPVSVSYRIETSNQTVVFTWFNQGKQVPVWTRIGSQ